MGFEDKVIEREERSFSEKNFFGRKKQPFVEAELAREKLEELGVETEGLEKFHRRFLKEMPEHINDIYEKYPEIRGYVSSIKAAKLPPETFARTRFCIDEKGVYKGAEILFSEKIFSKWNYELKIVDLESDLNWRGERYFAGEGTKGLITHEMAHVMQMKINAEDARVDIGEDNHWKIDGLDKRYFHNSGIITLCNNALKDLEISPRYVGSEVSTYASSDFGEMFAECMSRYETNRNPGRLSTEVHNRYKQLIEEREMRKVS